MNKNRIKQTAPAIGSRHEMETLARKIAELKIEQQTLTAGLDEAITAARATFQGRLGQIAEDLDGKMALASAWAEANPAEFGKTRSIDLTHATVGFRTGQPQLKTLPGWTWDRVLEKLRADGVAAFIRVKHEVDKQAILGAREKWPEPELRRLGVRVAQEESFFVEPKLTAVETRETAELAS